MIASARYKALPEPEEQNDKFNGRVKMVQAVIGRYREEAQRKLLTEYPEIAKKQKDIQLIRRRANLPTSADTVLSKISG